MIEVASQIHSKQLVTDLAPTELEAFFAHAGIEKYRATQVINAVYSGHADSFFDIKTLPMELRTQLDSDMIISAISSAKVRESADGSKKFLFKLQDHTAMEAVYMPWVDEDGVLERSTLCISTMVGCPVGCAFCATGTLGFKRNLSPGEIISQVLYVEKTLHTKIDNIVLMGMGEPLLNYVNVVKAINIITDDKIKMVGRRKITLSTSGIAPRIIQLAKEAKPVKLAISLHATTNGVRNKIMPISQSFDISKLMDAVEFYYRTTKMPITYEYIVFDGLNNTTEDVSRLAKIARRVPSKVNLLPYNDISFTNPPEFAKNLKPASRENMLKFADDLRDAGVAVIIRDTFGSDIEAACGQLALAEEKK